MKRLSMSRTVNLAGGADTFRNGSLDVRLGLVDAQFLLNGLNGGRQPTHFGTQVLDLMFELFQALFRCVGFGTQGWCRFRMGLDRL